MDTAMTDISIARAKIGSQPAGSLLHSLVGRILDRLAMFRAETELNGLSDQQLADLGLSRSQIHSAVRGEQLR
jgi:uncharacterized protein YjiS (DUF1127 family)